MSDHGPKCMCEHCFRDVQANLEGVIERYQRAQEAEAVTYAVAELRGHGFDPSTTISDALHTVYELGVRYGRRLTGRPVQPFAPRPAIAPTRRSRRPV
jgi:hypothetical protein